MHFKGTFVFKFSNERLTEQNRTIMTEPSYKMRVKNICDALRNLVAFVQFKKREKQPWRSVNFSKVAS